MFVLVLSGLVENCLLGLDVLCSCPATERALGLLKSAIQSTNPSKMRLARNTFNTKLKWTNLAIETRIREDSPDWNRISIPPKSAYEFNKSRFVEGLLEEFQEIVSTGMQSFRNWSIVKHEIELTEQKPFREKFRAVPYHKRDEFKKLIQELLDAGLIVPSKSNYSSPTNLVKKPDGSIRLTFDYTKLNSATIKDNYPLPIIPDLLHNFSNAIYFSKLDFDCGYFQLRMNENSRKYTAFSCEFGFFEWAAMPMGLKNAGASFQREMDELLKEYSGKFCDVYLDDIIIYSKSVEEHQNHLRIVFEKIRNASLKIKLKKCKFFETKIEYLGYVIENGTIRPSPTKTESLFKFEKPKTIKRVLAFLGLASYYRRFINDFATIASPLYRATTNTSKLEWNEDCEKSFETLRKVLTETDQVLRLPNFDLPFKLETDASDFGIGAVLSQQFDNENIWRPVAYYAKHMSKAERNYGTSEKELLAVVKSIENFKQYLYGREFTLVTDHQPLIWLMTMKNPAARLARWITRMEQYEFKIIHRKGKIHNNQTQCQDGRHQTKTRQEKTSSKTSE